MTWANTTTHANAITRANIITWAETITQANIITTANTIAWASTTTWGYPGRHRAVLGMVLYEVGIHRQKLQPHRDFGQKLTAYRGMA